MLDLIVSEGNGSHYYYFSGEKKMSYLPVKDKQEQFEADYNKALELSNELKRVLDTIICDIQYTKPQVFFPKLKKLQLRLLIELQDKGVTNLRHEIEEAVFNLNEIEDIRKWPTE
tara:strand:+ start:103 stop:447 length:345 start_codon:yes stop_codon:yes gene_type:complete